MRVGATISNAQMEYLRSLHPSVSPKYSTPLYDSGFREPMKVQFDTALKFYKNGTPYDFDALRCTEPTCRKGHSDVEHGGKLSKCAKCLDVVYCGRSCQATDWPVHKTICMTPQKREETERKRWTGHPFMMINV